jgi:hypothetical protein
MVAGREAVRVCQLSVGALWKRREVS